jgi:hypothetical protein
VCLKISVNYKRYPVDSKRKYLQSLGKLLPHRIGQIFQELGFRSWIAKGQSNDVDLKVFDDKDNLILVAEILNWSSHSRMSEIRRNWIINNLSRYNCHRLLIYTVFENEKILDDFDDYGFSLLKIGFQLLPKSFYNFFVRKNQVENRKRDSRVSKQDIKSKIIEYLQSSSMEILIQILKVVK